MARRTASPETRLAVIEEHPVKGDRARFTTPVRADVEGAVARAEQVRAKVAAETGHTVRVDTFTHAA